MSIEEVNVKKVYNTIFNEFDNTRNLDSNDILLIREYLCNQS